MAVSSTVAIDKVRNLIKFSVQQKPMFSLLIVLALCTKQGIQMVAEEIWNHLETEGKVSIVP